jgi:hypothetical protein
MKLTDFVHLTLRLCECFARKLYFFLSSSLENGRSLRSGL